VIGLRLKQVHRRGRAVRVRAAEEDVDRGYSSLSFDHLFGGAIYACGQHAQVHECKRNPRVAIVENQGLGVQVVVYIPAMTFREASSKRAADVRVDICCRGSGANFAAYRFVY
jgi:hypothetical protein